MKFKEMKIFKSLLILLSGIIIFSGCKKDKEENPPLVTKPKDVYVAGYEINTNFTDRQATYWKNGTKINLPTETFYSTAQSIFVTNDAVYIAGRDIQMQKPVLWKNEERIALEHSLGGGAYSVFVK
jgi:hypothetical protein